MRLDALGKLHGLFLQLFNALRHRLERGYGVAELLHLGAYLLVGRHLQDALHIALHRPEVVIIEGFQVAIYAGYQAAEHGGVHPNGGREAVVCNILYLRLKLIAQLHLVVHQPDVLIGEFFILCQEPL